jgi:hypothetical protein
MSTTTLRKSQDSLKKGKSLDLLGDGGVIKEAILKPPTSNKDIDRVGHGAEVTSTLVMNMDTNY